MKTKYAKDGMWLINGDVIVKSVNLPDTADPDVWHEITEAEYEALMESIIDENAAIISPSAEQRALWWEITAEEREQLERQLAEEAAVGESS